MSQVEQVEGPLRVELASGSDKMVTSLAVNDLPGMCMNVVKF